jgi:hypothetical protein
MVNHGPTLEEFACKHRLPQRWMELREECNRLVARPDFWYRADVRDEARQLAVEASDILSAALKHEKPAGNRPLHNAAENADDDLWIASR